MTKHFRIPGYLRQKLVKEGVNVSAVLSRAGLPQGLFDQVRVLVSTKELFALWRSLAEVSNDPTIGLRLGTDTRIDQFHPLCIAALAAENFSSAINQMARYKQLTCPEEIVSTIEGDELSIQFRWLLAEEPEPPLFVEHCFAWMHTIASIGSGSQITPARVEFTEPRPHLSEIEKHFGCAVVCNAPRNAIIFHAKDADKIFVTRNAELLAMLRPQFEEELRQREVEEKFSDRVRRAILERLTGSRPSIHAIARELHISARTLQRRLQDEELSFQSVLEEARHQMASHYLTNSVMELNEIAYLLGYEDPNSFVRAFRLRVGIPPGHWRESHRSKVASLDGEYVR